MAQKEGNSILVRVAKLLLLSIFSLLHYVFLLINLSQILDVAFLLSVSIQLMHSFEVNIRICQPENSDVHRGEAEVNITFEG